MQELRFLLGSNEQFPTLTSAYWKAHLFHTKSVENLSPFFFRDVSVISCIRSKYSIEQYKNLTASKIALLHGENSRQLRCGDFFSDQRVGSMNSTNNVWLFLCLLSFDELKPMSACVLTKKETTDTAISESNAYL